MSKRYIAILIEFSRRYVVMIADKKPWIQLEDGSWFFQAEGWYLRSIDDYKAFLASFRLPQ